MRMVFVALLAALFSLVALTVPPSSAQKMQGPKKEEPKKKTNDDKDYKSAVDRLPDQKYDPWRNFR